ncbi:MAG: sigma-70 family RNA polymerase sigma factor [Leptolinea sp.]|jgi:RNA polymerase sigma-70 factor (ECF subfamily)|nr:sigma-70 family RNA polymerase sigma factor [Leptolinea sp.]
MINRTTSEDDLFARFRSSDPAPALSELFDTYADPIYRLAVNLLGDADSAEDVVQETFVSAITHRETFEGRSRLSSWLYRIAYNAALARLRSRREDPLPEDEPDEESSFPLPRSLVEWTMTPEQMLADSEAAEHLQKAIQSLPLKYRVVFFLRDMEDQPTAQVAEVLGLTETAVKVRLHRARLALREILSEYFAEMTGA